MIEGKGEWRIAKVATDAPGGPFVEIEDDTHSIATVIGWGTSQEDIEEMMARAQLITAAKELVDACQMAYERLSEYVDEDIAAGGDGYGVYTDPYGEMAPTLAQLLGAMEKAIGIDNET